MRVLLLSRYGPLGSTSRLRFYQYLPYLEDQGLDVLVAPLVSDDYVVRLYAGERQPFGYILDAYIERIAVLLRSGRFDLLWVEKEFLPWLPAVVPGLLSVPYVVDYDDAAFHRYDLHKSRLVRAVLGRKIDRVMRGAALVVAGNGYLADRARRAGARRVEILPTVIDTDRYGPAHGAGPGGFRIGWIGAPVTAPYLRAIEPALAALLAEPGVKLTIVGAEDPFEGRLPLRTRFWKELTEAEDIARFDVGIMPLPDEPFERGKCGYKLIQYMGCSLPVVASPVGVNARIVEPGVNGFLAETTAEWITALQTLRGDPDLRRRLGEAGRRKVEESFSLSGTAPRLLGLLESVVRVRR